MHEQDVKNAVPYADRPVKPHDAVIGIRAMRRLALLLAVGGLFLLYRAARQRELPLITAADLTPSMQFAPVRARGVLLQPVRKHRREGEIIVVSFRLRGHEGELQAVAFGETARALAENGSMPAPGELLEISGILQFSSRYGPQIHIRLPEHVAVLETRAPPGTNL